MNRIRTNQRLTYTTDSMELFGKYMLSVNIKNSGHLQDLSSLHLICIYIWRVLFQNALNANPKIDVAMPIPSPEIMFWKRGLYKCVLIYAHVHTWKDLYQNTILELGIASSFSGTALNAFWNIPPYTTYIMLYMVVYMTLIDMTWTKHSNDSFPTRTLNRNATLQ